MELEEKPPDPSEQVYRIIKCPLKCVLKKYNTLQLYVILLLLLNSRTTVRLMKMVGTLKNVSLLIWNLLLLPPASTKRRCHKQKKKHT